MSRRAPGAPQHPAVAEPPSDPVLIEALQQELGVAAADPRDSTSDESSTAAASGAATSRRAQDSSTIATGMPRARFETWTSTCRCPGAE